MAALWEMMPFRKKPKRPEYYVDNRPQGLFFSVIGGNYDGVIVTYDTAEFVADAGLAKLKFNFNIVYAGTHIESVLTNDQDFVTILGDILQDYIINGAEKLETD